MARLKSEIKSDVLRKLAILFELQHEKADRRHKILIEWLQQIFVRQGISRKQLDKYMAKAVEKVLKT